ncbi:MAG: LysR family transcriptional regulator [Gluconacetobacter liquefaciens]
MDTRFLETFVDVVERGSMAGAARKAGLSSGSIAQRIHTLERDLGVALIERHGQTVKPTAAGRAILVQSKRILMEIESLSRFASHLDNEGEITLGAISTALTGLLPDLLNAFLSAHPRISLYTVPGSSLVLYDQVINHRLDAAIIVEPPYAPPKTCGWRPLRDEPLTLVVPAGWEHADPLDLLGTRPFVRYDRNHWGGKIVDRYLKKHAITPHERLEMDCLEAIVAIVAQKGGVALLPAWSTPWPPAAGIVSMTLGDSAPIRRVGVLWHRSSPRCHLLKYFLTLLDAATYGRTIAHAP